MSAIRCHKAAAAQIFRGGFCQPWKLMVAGVFSVVTAYFEYQSRSFLALFKGVPCRIVISVLEYVK